MRQNNGREIAGIAAMAGCAFLWSLAGLLIKLVDWNPFAIGCGRSLTTIVFLMVWIRKPRFTFSFAQVAAAVASAATMILFVFANKATTSANAILLQYSAPVHTAVLGAILLGERPRAEHWAAFAAVIGGMILFFLGNLGGGSLVGNIAAVASGLTFALYFVFMRMQKDGSPIESALLAHILTAVASFAVCCFLPAPRLTAPSVAIVIALGVFQIGFATVLFSYGISRVTAVQGVIAAGLEPVFNPLWVFLATGETPAANALAGGGVIIAAVVASSIVSVRRDRARTAAGPDVA